MADLRGAYALGVVALADPDTMTGRAHGLSSRGGPGRGREFPGFGRLRADIGNAQVLYLEDGDVVALKVGGVRVLDIAGRDVKREVHLSELSRMRSTWSPTGITCKEIHEQPRAVADTLEGVIDAGIDVDDLFGAGAMQAFAGIDSLLILASGTSFYAGLVALLVRRARADSLQRGAGPRYRYRESIPNPRQLVITISQSGETLDTMEALKRAKELGHPTTLSICNVRERHPRASRFVFYTRAGAEIGVASTKAFTTQLAALFTLCLALSKVKGRLSPQAEADAIDQLRYVPGSIQHALNLEPQIQAWSERFAQRDHALFLGRGIHYPVALEGALKLKEISLHPRGGVSAGELKHGRWHWWTRRCRWW